MIPAPATKQDFRRRYFHGEFGNRPASWPSLSELQASGYKGMVTIRSGIPGGPCRYCVPVAEITPDYASGFYFNESMPDERLLIQGEVFRDVGGLHLTYSLEPGLSMRAAMEHPKSATGLVASMTLKKYLWPASYDDLEVILDGYDGIVEFSAYDSAVGVCHHRNMVVWEVRAY